MKTTVKFILIMMVSLFFQCDAISQNIKNPELAKEIRDMKDANQKLRKKWAKLAKVGKTETKKFKALTNKIFDMDSSNRERMKAIIKQHGWPTYSLVGKKASVSAWLIVQHADRDPFFQIKCLPLLKEAADNGESDLVNYAFLYDRVQINKGKKQLYATQSTTNNGITEGNFQPIEDEANVQNRRAEMGFDLHVETYAKKLGFNYKIPTKEEAKKKSKAFAEVYNLNIIKAKQAMSSKNYNDAVTHYLKALNSNGSIQVEDYIETARTSSLSKHEESKWAPSFLIKAIINGYNKGQEFLTEDDFSYLKEASPRNWNSLKRVINQTASK